jgi:type I restriction enzyme, S subunit
MRQVDIVNAIDITNERVKPFTGEKKYLSTGDLSNEGIDNTISVDYKNKPSRADLTVKKGDLILARMQATNKVYLIDNNYEDLIVSTGFLTLRPKEGYDGKYLYHYFRSKIFQKNKDRFCTGATQKAINNNLFKRLKVPYYEIERQKQISNILEKVDIVFQKRKEQLALLDDYLKSFFLEMFGDPVSNDKNWEFHKLGKFTSYIGSGSTPLGGSSNYQKSGIIFIRSQNVLMNKFDFSDVAYIPMQIHENMKRTFVKKNDILFNITGASIGRVAVFNGVDDSANVNQHVCIIRLNNKNLNPLFLSHFIAQPTFQTIVISRNSGATRQAFNFQQIKNFNIYLPPIELQNKFAAIVNQTKDIKQKMQESLNEMDDYFNSLMQRYFG